MGVSYSNIVIAVTRALGEVGYRERASAVKAGPPWNNWQKYSPAVPGLEWSQNQPWCATFLSWLFIVAGLTDVYPRSASVPSMWNWAKTNGIQSEYPAIGALAVFGKLQHIGIVVWFDALYVYTVEGNTNDDGSPEGNGVYLKRHLRTDPWVMGYILPNPAKLVLPSADPAYNDKHMPKIGTPAADASYATLNPADLQKAGIKALGGYLSDTPSKNLTRDEAIRYARFGVASFLFFENHKGDAGKGYQQGVADAKNAQAQAAKMGVPTSVPILFTVDTGDLTWEKVKPYFDGARSVLKTRVGTYGSFFITTAARADGILYTVQTQGWSKGLLDPYANAVQWARAPKVPGTDDETIFHAMPLWAPEDKTYPAPPPAPSPVDGQQIALIKHYAVMLGSKYPAGTPIGDAARKTIIVWKDIK